MEIRFVGQQIFHLRFISKGSEFNKIPQSVSRHLMKYRNSESSDLRRTTPTSDGVRRDALIFTTGAATLYSLVCRNASGWQDLISVDKRAQLARRFSSREDTYDFFLWDPNIRQVTLGTFRSQFSCSKQCRLVKSFFRGKDFMILQNVFLAFFNNYLQV